MLPRHDRHKQRYGACATGKRDAMAMVQQRLTSEGSSDRPAGAHLVGACDWHYGTVLHYGDDVDAR